LSRQKIYSDLPEIFSNLDFYVLKSFTLNRETNPIVLFDHELLYLI